MSEKIFERLREERKRLGKTQEEFAEIAGVTRVPYAVWERGGGPTPPAQSLAALAKAGADVLYILTGNRSAPVESRLSPRAQALLANYEATDPEGQRAIERTALLEAESTAAKGLGKKRRAG